MTPEDVSTHPLPPATGLVGGRYRVLHALGRGAMGDVYLAEDTKLHRRVAIKCIRAEHVASAVLMERIKRECLLHARIGAHPHIVTLFDLVDGQDQIHLVMEYVEGRTLDRVLKEQCAGGARLPLVQSLTIAIQCLEALAHVHRHGIIHRDIKPANVILTESKSEKVTAKLMDFGIARLEEDDPAAATLTRPGDRSPGTPLYMSPEQIDSSAFGPVTPASDIYAMGVMLYHLLASKPPFTGTMTDIFNGHLNFTPKPIVRDAADALDSELERVIARALSKRPADRFPSAEAFAEALRPFAARDGRALAAGTDSAPAPVRGADILPGIRWMAAAGALALMAVGGSVLWRAIPDGAAPVVAPPAPLLNEQERDATLEPFEDVAPPELPEPETVQLGHTSPAVAEAEPPVEATPDASGDVPAPAAAEVNAPEDWTLEEVTLTTPGPMFGVTGAGADPSAPAAPLPEIIPPDPNSATPARPTAAAKPADPDGPAAADPDAAGAPSAPLVAVSVGPTHIVRRGDTIQSIAGKYDVSAADIIRWNALKNPDVLTVGQTLYLSERPGAAPVEVKPAAPEEKGQVRELLDKTKQGLKNFGKKVRNVGK